MIATSAASADALTALSPGRLPRIRAERAFDGALAISFSAFLILQIARHAMWRDELNAWGIVLASPSLADLFHHMHYEGHPALWHLLLWITARFTSAPQAVQVVHATLGCGIIGLIAFASPFNRAEKLLLLLSYFFLFEYTVMSRNYALGVLIGFAYAHLRARWPEGDKRLAVLLGLLANTNVFALFLSAALALEYAVAEVGRKPGAWRPAFRRLGPALAIYASLVLFAVVTFWPASDISWRTTGAPLAQGLTLDHVMAVLINNASALVPVTQQAFWAPPRLIDVEAYSAERLAILLALPVLAFAMVRIFADRKPLLLIPAVTLALSLAFNLVFYDGSVRHWGIQFIAFVIAFWILRAGSKRASPLSFAILTVNAVAGIVFTVQHWTVTFSNARATADWLRTHAEPATILAGTPDYATAAVSEYLGRSAYFLDCRCSDSYLLFQKRRDDFSPGDVPGRLVEAKRIAGARPLLFLLGGSDGPDPVQAIENAGLRLTELAHFDGALTENFRIYSVERRNGPSPRPSLSPSAEPTN